MGEDRALHVLLVDVSSKQKYTILKKHAYTPLRKPKEILHRVYLLGTCELYSKSGQPTIAYLFEKFGPGRPFERNFDAQRDARKNKMDKELLHYIQHDTTWLRQCNLIEALEDLNRQINPKYYDSVIVHAEYSKLFNEEGSYLQILRKIFVIQNQCKLFLNLEVGKNYVDLNILSQVDDADSTKTTKITDGVDYVDGYM